MALPQEGVPVHKDDSFELVAIVYSQDELAVLTSRLRFEGIWVVEQSARHVGADWALTVALGGVGLLVHHEDAPDAWTVLAETTRWQRTGGVYARSRILDLVMALLLAIYPGLPPPARIPAVLVERRSG
ncbi:MAG TPA: hypothetical protein VGB54_14165 [Allosphingosinicella sp.]|jgi:hypothetical protein